MEEKKKKASNFTVAELHQMEVPTARKTLGVLPDNTKTASPLHLQANTSTLVQSSTPLISK